MQELHILEPHLEPQIPSLIMKKNNDNILDELITINKLLDASIIWTHVYYNINSLYLSAISPGN